MIEKWFKLKEHGTNARTEMTAGLTTFLTMVYIVVVNPAILSGAGCRSNRCSRRQSSPPLLEH